MLWLTNHYVVVYRTKKYPETESYIHCLKGTGGKCGFRLQRPFEVEWPLIQKNSLGTERRSNPAMRLLKVCGMHGVAVTYVVLKFWDRLRGGALVGTGAHSATVASDASFIMYSCLEWLKAK
jgi:hypothetical protein